MAHIFFTLTSEGLMIFLFKCKFMPNLDLIDFM